MANDVTKAVSVFSKELNDNGLKEIEKVMKNLLSEHRNKPINICITGDIAVGKSSLISGLLGISTQRVQNKESVPYTNEKQFPGVVFWDVPSSQLKTEKGDIDIEAVTTFDGLIICSCRRFSELDFNLAKIAHENNVPLFYVRTKLDNDIENEKRDRGDAFNEAGLVKSIREDAANNLKHAGVSHLRIYVLSTVDDHQENWDFPSLHKELEENSPSKNCTKLKNELVVVACIFISEAHDRVSGLIPGFINQVVDSERQQQKETLRNGIDNIVRNRYGLDNAVAVRCGDPYAQIEVMLDSRALDVPVLYKVCFFALDLVAQAVLVKIGRHLGRKLGIVSTAWCHRTNIKITGIVVGVVTGYCFMEFAANQMKQRSISTFKTTSRNILNIFNTNLKDAAIACVTEISQRLII